jgi:hypothetical protein
MTAAPSPKDDTPPEPPKSSGTKFFSLSAADISVLPELNVDDFPIEQADPTLPNRKYPNSKC